MKKSDLAIARKLLLWGLRGKGGTVSYRLLAWQDAIDRLGLDAKIYKVVIPGKVSPYECVGPDADAAALFVSEIARRFSEGNTDDEHLDMILDCMQKHKKKR